MATGAQEGAYGPASWIQGLGAWSRTDGDGNAAALKRSSGGFLMGLDAPLAQTWRVGVMAGYSRSDFDVNDRASSGRSDNYHLGAYGGGQWARWACAAAWPTAGTTSPPVARSPCPVSPTVSRPAMTAAAPRPTRT